MNKNILIYYSKLNIGGAEKSLVRLMNALVKDGNCVTLLTRYSGGTCECFLDKRIKKLSLSDTSLQRDGKTNFFRKSFVWAQRKYRLYCLKHRREHYDAAIVGLQGLSPEVIVKYVHADKRATFIRNDIASFAASDRVAGIIREYAQQMDAYFCVAETVRQSLISTIPEIRTKAHVLYNLLDVEEMKANLEMAENPFPSDQKMHIVSVCRVSDVSKGIFRMLNVARKLRAEGFSFTWYLVGDGPDLDALKARITETEMSETFVCVGRINNPFGYYKYCDLVAVLSYYEGLCGIVNEAKVAGKAVIATEFSGIHEQLTHGANGWIVENDEDAILSGMRKLLSDQSALAQITNGEYPAMLLDDQAKLERLYQLMEWK